MKCYLMHKLFTSNTIEIHCGMVKVSEGYIYFYNLGEVFRELKADDFRLYVMEDKP